MDKFVPKRKAGEPVKKRPAKRAAAAKKLPTDPVAIAKQAVARTDRLVLEEAIVALVSDGAVSVERLAELGIAPAAVKTLKEKVTATAQLRSTGTMGSWERLDQELIVAIIEHASSLEKFQLSETCKGLCALRREPRAWTSLDVGEMKGLTAPGLRRLPSSIPTARLERLRLDEPSRDSKFSATDWVAFLKQLECQDNLKRLDLASKKFGAGAKALQAVERLAPRLETFKINELKGKCVDNALKLLKAMPRLVDLEMSGSDVTYQFFLQRVAQLAAHQRGAGARSLLQRFAHVGFCWGASVDFRFVALQVKSLFPELTSLELRGITTNEMPVAMPPASPASRLRVLKLRNVKFMAGAGFAPSSVYYGPQAIAQSAGALAAYVTNCEAAFPALEVWWTHRACESLSSKERAGGATYQPPPVLNSTSLAVRFPHLRELLFANVDVDKNSFVNWDAPSLEKVRLDPVGEASWQAASSWGKRYPSAASRKPIVQPLLEGAEGDVEVDYAPLKRFDE